MEKIRVTVWNEFVHEVSEEHIKKVYPNGIHQCIADFLGEEADFEVRTATLNEPEHGLSQEVIDNTDVLLWWGHAAHHLVSDEIAARVQDAVLTKGMGFIPLHSAHFSKPFGRLMGTTCALLWREDDKSERVWALNPAHPIAQGVGYSFQIPHTEMYGEPFDIPHPDEEVFISWYEGGEVIRSGMCWRRGMGKVFYFAPGHETYPIYYQKEVQTVIKNAIRWAVAPKGFLRYRGCVYQSSPEEHPV